MENLTIKGANIFARTAACAALALCGSANAQVVINEIDYVQAGLDNGEFIELYATQPTSLAPLSLQLVEGASGTVYQTIDLPPVELASGDFFVVCGSSSVTPNCDLEAPTAVDFIRNDLPGAIALVSASSIMDTVSFGGNSVAPYTELVGAEPDEEEEANLGLSRGLDGFDSNFNDFDFVLYCTTPGTSNQTAMQPCDGIYQIAEIQGSTVSSPVASQVVRTEANIVTGVREGSSLGGFYMETPLSRRDSDPLTSEGIFVETGNTPAVAVGDMVNVEGLVTGGDRTEFTDSPIVEVVSSGHPLPPAIMFDGSTPSPLQPVDRMEKLRFEGMRVQFSGVAASASRSNGFMYAVPTMQRPFLEPGIEFPGEIGLPVWDGNEEILGILLSGTEFTSTRIFAGQVMSVVGHMRGGSPLALDIWPAQIDVGPEPQLPRGVRPGDDDELVIVTQHMGLFHDTEDNPDTIDSVYSEEALNRRLVKFSYHIRETLAAPDIIAVQDVETLELLELLAAQIASDDATLSYSAFHHVDTWTDGVGFLVRDDRVSVQGLDIVGEASPSIFYRQPLAIDVSFSRGDATLDLTLISVQLSLFSEPFIASGNWLPRARMAVFLAEYIEAAQLANPDQNIVVLGDFGAPQFSNGLADLLGQITGVPDPQGAQIPYEPIVTTPLTNLTNTLPQPEQYATNVEGNLVAYDHVVVNANLTERVAEYVMTRGNNDVPRPAGDDADQTVGLRVASRDAAVLYLKTDVADADADGVTDSNDNCTEVSNVDQRDTNGDGFGNLCDADLNNDGIINVIDLGLLRGAFFSATADADFNGDGTVNVQDLGIMRSTFFLAPGPSGLVEAP